MLRITLQPRWQISQDGGPALDANTLLQLLAAVQARTQAGTLKATALNAMTSHVAVIDNRGVILETNASWQNFARRSGYVGDVSFVGLNYLDALSRTEGAGAETAVAVSATQPFPSVTV